MQALGAFRFVSSGIAVATAAVTVFPAWMSVGGESFSQFTLLFDDDYEGVRPYAMLCLLTLSLAGAFVTCAVGGDRLSELHSAFARAGFFAVASYAGLGSIYPTMILSDEWVAGTVREGAVLNVVFASAGVALSCLSAGLAQRLPESSPRLLPTVLFGAAWGMLLIWISNDVGVVAEFVGAGVFPEELRRDAWLVRLAVVGTMMVMALAPILVWAVIPHGDRGSHHEPAAPRSKGPPPTRRSQPAIAQPSDALVASIFQPNPVETANSTARPNPGGRCAGCGALFSVSWLRMTAHGRLCNFCVIAAAI